MRESTTDYRVLRNYGNKRKDIEIISKMRSSTMNLAIYCQPDRTS